MIPRNLFHTMILLPWAANVLLGGAAHAQTPNRIASTIDPSQTRVLANHHPVWAVPANDTGAVPANQAMENLTLVLERSPEQEQAFEQLLKEQQNPASANYHKWLTATELGDRFGLSDDDISAITGWLQSQGLQVSGDRAQPQLHRLWRHRRQPESRLPDGDSFLPRQRQTALVGCFQIP